MKNFCFIITIIVLNMAVSPTAWGKTLYVRPSGGEYGTEDGQSYETAFDGFSNIKWGKTGVDEGDELMVCGFHEGETLFIGVSGSKNSPIVIDGGFPEDPGRINCGVSEKKSRAAIETNGFDYIKIQNLRIEGKTEPIFGGIEIESGSSNISIKGCNFNPNKGRGIRIWGGAKDCTVIDCFFNGNGVSGNFIHLYAPSKTELRGVLIYQNVFKNSGSRSIAAYWSKAADIHSVDIRNNIIIGGKAGVRFVPGKNARKAYNIDINGNEIKDSLEASIRIEWTNSNGGTSYVRNNTVVRTGGKTGTKNMNGIRVGACSNVIVQNNDVFGVNSSFGDGNGIIVDQAKIGGEFIPSDGIIVRYNRCYGNTTQGGSGISVYKSKNSKVYYNLCYDNKRGVSVGEPAESALKSTGTKVFNNVMYGNEQCGGLVREGAGNSLWRNNIAAKNGKYGFCARAGCVLPISSNNCVFRNEKGAYNRWVDTKSINSDPLFKDATNKDFRLKKGSPCINAGFTEGLLLRRDFRGVSVPQNGYDDIGAFEYSQIHLWIETSGYKKVKR